jgi:hypothetical protein
MPDLITPTRAQYALDSRTLSPAQLAIATTQLPALITAASKAIERHCGRFFGLASYDRVYTPRLGQWDKNEPDQVYLEQFPVTALSRVSGGRVTALKVSNADRVNNQRAALSLTYTGDPEVQLSFTGVQLTWVAAGVANAASLAFAAYPTVQALATAIAAVGSGWTAAVMPGYASWASAELYGPYSPSGALGMGQGTNLDVFSTDYQAGDLWLDPPTGLLELSRAPAGVSGYSNDGFGPGDPFSNNTGGTYGRPQVRIAWTAGFATIPEPVQQACTLVVQSMFWDGQLAPRYRSESLGDHSWTLDPTLVTLPPAAIGLLAPYRVYRT